MPRKKKSNEAVKLAWCPKCRVPYNADKLEALPNHSLVCPICKGFCRVIYADPPVNVDNPPIKASITATEMLSDAIIEIATPILKKRIEDGIKFFMS